MTAGAAPPLAVVDTSVHLSAIRFARSKDSPAKEVLARGLSGHFDFAVSDLLLNEIARKLVEKSVSPILVSDFLAELVRVGKHFIDATIAGVVCDDPEDIFVIALGQTASAWCIVAQDRALTEHKATPPGWSPPKFLARLREVRGEPENQRHTVDVFGAS